jgi:glyoxylase-like metal-dependent hydrolase (beta-lactamase superfamily II)
MRQIFPDLWQTRLEQPIPDVPELKTHAYLLRLADGEQILFYSSGHADEHRHIAGLGGIRQQYLSHADEAGPALRAIGDRFGAELWCHHLEAEAVRERSGRAPDGTFGERETRFGALEIIPTPGHTPGSTCFVYTSPHGGRYLFTGDTIGMDEADVWRNGYIQGMSDKAALATSLQMLATLRPDVVISSAFGGPQACRAVSPEEWCAAVDEALAPLWQSAPGVPADDPAAA